MSGQEAAPGAGRPPRPSEPPPTPPVGKDTCGCGKRGSGGNGPSMGPKERWSLFGPYRLPWGSRR